jgi:hypothetical protein
MTWNGRHPLVQLVEKTYHTGQRLTQKAMTALEQRWDRLPGLATLNPDLGNLETLFSWKSLRTPPH